LVQKKVRLKISSVQNLRPLLKNQIKDLKPNFFFDLSIISPVSGVKYYVLDFNQQSKKPFKENKGLSVIIFIKSCWRKRYQQGMALAQSLASDKVRPTNKKLASALGCNRRLTMNYYLHQATA
jgi:hypothetical protein